jgi:hypothetical protein
MARIGLYMGWWWMANWDFVEKAKEFKEVKQCNALASAKTKAYPSNYGERLPLNGN